MPYLTKAYIDKNYYTSGYIPNIQASIESKYTLGERNAANFESFSMRASEAVNRLTNNSIESLGGIEKLSPFPQSFSMKATAALVEYWYLNDFNLGQIDASFQAGAASADSVATKKVKTTSGMRLFIPETVLWLMQTSGLTDQTWIGVHSEEELASGVIPGFSITDFFTKAEALALFQQAGDYDENFHKDISLQSNLGTAGVPRYFKIFESEDGGTNAVFSIIGGNEVSVLGAKQIISVTASNGVIDVNESTVVTLNPKANDANIGIAEPDFIATIENNKIVVYVETKSGQDITDLLVTDITPDTGGLFQLYTASDNKPLGDLLPKLTVVQSSGTTSNLQLQIDDNKVDITTNATGIKTNADAIVLKADATELITINSNIANNKSLSTTNAGKITTIESNIVSLGGSKMDVAVADTKFIIRDTDANSADTARMGAGYIPVNGQDVAVRETVSAVENTLNRAIGDVEARLSGLEGDTLTQENWIDGNFALTGDGSSGTLDALAIQGDKGDFDYTSGKTLEISAFDQTNGLGGTAKVVVGKTNPQSITLASGTGTSETVGVSVDTKGIITIMESTSGIDVSNDIVIDRIAQTTIGGVNGSFALKTDVDKKQNIDITTYNGTAVTVETALNENRTLINGNTSGVSTNKTAIADNKVLIGTNTSNIATIGAKPVSGGDLLSTAETLATEKFATDADTKVLADAKAYTDAHTPATKTVTIPAEYGWVKVDPTKPIDNAKWRTQNFRCIVYVGTLVKNRYELSLKIKQYPTDAITVLFFESSPDGVYSPTISSMNPGNLGSGWPVDADNYYEMWDIITPAQTVKVLA